MARMFEQSRRTFLAATGLAGLAFAAGGDSAAAAARAALSNRPRKPNILFIMADDMGYADLSCYGAQGYRTPVLDQLASDGMRFTQAYANCPICSPTRVALLTGRYQGHFNAGLNEPNVGFPPGQEIPIGTPTVASLLRDAGYRTALVGKFHVAKVPEFGPQRYGYDSFFGITGGGADYFLHRANQDGDVPEAGLHEGSRPVGRDGYMTDILADEAIRQIKSGESKPLFLSLHFTAPHWPWEGPEDAERAKQLKDMRDRSGGSLETYAKMMMSLDANIGRVLQALTDEGMADDTIVLFTSDNGAERYSNTWPLVGYKGELLEGGIRVPMIVRWPGRIRPGSVTDQVAISMDTVPTYLAAAGVGIPGYLEGHNLLPQLLGEAAPMERTLYWRMRANDQAAVRQGDWKYLRVGGKEHLFNIRQDPRERAELLDLHPDVVKELKAKWEAWNATMLPYPEKSFSEATSGNYADRFPDAPPQPWQLKPKFQSN